MIFFRVTALGCKVNSYEAQAISQTLVRAGLVKWPGTGPVGLCVIHSCCITAEAARKTRQLTRKLHQQHPGAAILLSGCYARAEKSASELPGVRWCASDDSDLAELLRKVASELSRANQTSTSLQNRPESPLADDTAVNHINIRPSQDEKVKDNHCKASLSQQEEFLAPSVQFQDRFNNENTLPPTANLDAICDFGDRTRAAVKMQDGCDRFCSYCIIPQLRNRLYSRSISDILDEISTLLENGYREIVLCGINLGAYGFNSVRNRPAGRPSEPFAKALAAIAAHVGDSARLRISSLDPSDIYPELVKVLAENSNICPHLHLSLQSGSDSVLAAMNRNYDSAGFLNSVRLIKDALDTPAITTDIIVGFPGETHQDVLQTIKIAELTKFSRVHVFPYSPRANTKAATISAPRASKAETRIHIAAINKVAQECEIEYKLSLTGKDAAVLIEGVNTDKIWGYCQRYLRHSLDKNTHDCELGQIIDTQYDFRQ